MVKQIRKLLSRPFLCGPFLWGVVALCMSMQAQAQLSQLQVQAESEGAWRIQPLEVADNQAYYQAYQSSQAMLYRTLGWGWPSTKQTAEGNEDTMRFHVEQHEAKRAFTYVIRESDHLALRGALFINPVHSRSGLPGFDSDRYEVEVTFWLNQQGQDSAQADELMGQINQWLAQEWGIRSILYPIAQSNQFARQQAERHGLQLVTEDRNSGELLYTFRAR